MKTKKIMTKRFMAVVLVLAMIMGGFCIAYRNTNMPFAGNSVKVGRGMYTITSEKKKTARFDRVSKKSVTTLSIPATVKLGKKTYKVTAIKANALKNNKKIKKLTIGKNVKAIGKNAFCCKNLKDITIKTTKLTMKSVGKNAFKGLNGKVNITVPDSKLAAYQKLLKARGVTGKNQVIKSGKPTTETPSKKPTVIPDPKVEFRTGRFHDSNPLLTDYWTDTTTEADCMVGKRQEFAIRVDVPTEMYGYWTIEKVKSDFKITCTACQQVSGTEKDDAVHGAQTGHYGYTILKKKNNVFDASVWHPDNTPCSIVYHATLPEGMEFVEDSISIAKLSMINTLSESIDASNYQITINENNLTICIKDIKSSGFYSSSGNISYRPIVASFSAKMTDSAAAINQVTASVSYSQGKNSKTIPANTVTINKK